MNGIPATAVVEISIEEAVIGDKLKYCPYVRRSWL